MTEIEDALALWAKLKEQKGLFVNCRIFRREKLGLEKFGKTWKAHERFNPHIDEEFEDSEGNVVNRKTYDDMRRQGIL